MGEIDIELIQAFVHVCGEYAEVNAPVVHEPDEREADLLVVRHSHHVGAAQQREGQLDQGQRVGWSASVAKLRLACRCRHGLAEAVDPTVQRGSGHLVEFGGLRSFQLDVRRITATAMEPSPFEFVGKGAKPEDWPGNVDGVAEHSSRMLEHLDAPRH
eukprot:6576269-Pyramimonas_sp.AAC.3